MARTTCRTKRRAVPDNALRFVAAWALVFFFSWGLVRADEEGAKGQAERGLRLAMLIKLQHYPFQGQIGVQFVR